MKTWSCVAGIVLAAALPAAAQEPIDAQLAALLADAAQNNPDVQAARREASATRSRISPAGALDDPMLEAGVLNYPVESRSFKTEDMTMKMIGFTQRLPYPGKRALRREVAESEALTAEANLQELANRVRRDVKVAYFDLGFVDESLRLAEGNRRVLEQYLALAETRYSVGQGTQADVLKAQTQVSKMREELIKLGRERPMLESELNRAAGRAAAPAAITPPPAKARDATFELEELRAAARVNRPQLAAQQRMMDRNTRAVALARKDYYPDFDVRVSYGQRDNSADMRREDMISFTVAINLPMWRESKRDPRVAEAESMREQASAMYVARLNELDAMLRQQVAAAEQSLKSVRLYETGLLPQARLTADASLAAYRVGRVDFFSLLDSRMTVFNAEVGYAASLAAYNKALAEIEFLIGKLL
ncbi:MAG TPA: TolC family protein [Burkholderiales bacterium]|nr:TolC family protein [Burkholderiales bacterium]